MSASVLSGTAAARGVGIGPARILAGLDFEVPEYTLEADQVGAEIERYRAALAAARDGLLQTARRAQANVVAEVADLVDTHLLMLSDSTLAEGPLEFIRSRSINAEWALRMVRDTLVAAFEAMEDEYFRSRVDDVEQVVTRIQAALSAAAGRSLEAAGGLSGAVVVAVDISPPDLVELAEKGVVGFIVEGSGPQAHSAILARAMGLPMIVGVRNAHEMINEGALVIVDGDRGFALIDPDAERLTRYRERQQEARRRAEQLRRLSGAPTQSRDGVAIALYANAEVERELRLAREAGAAGVGLFRTEYLFMGRRNLPSEDEQFESYRAAVLALGGLPVTFRTLDVGADKQLPLGHELEEPNPALGLRGIRLSLRFPELFRDQIRAILRAAAYGPVRILLPMLTSPVEAIRARELIVECADELAALGVPVPEQVDVGGMIEVPAAALAVREFAAVLDFLSIGTNDLTQYTLAVDRGNRAVSSFYDHLHPAVLRLIVSVLDAAGQYGRRVSLCGELAGEARCAPLLLALGLRELSMHPGVLLEVKEMIGRIDVGALTGLRERILLAAPGDTLAVVESELNLPRTSG